MRRFLPKDWFSEQRFVMQFCFRSSTQMDKGTNWNLHVYMGHGVNWTAALYCVACTHRKSSKCILCLRNIFLRFVFLFFQSACMSWEAVALTWEYFPWRMFFTQAWNQQIHWKENSVQRHFDFPGTHSNCIQFVISHDNWLRCSWCEQGTTICATRKCD